MARGDRSNSERSSAERERDREERERRRAERAGSQPPSAEEQLPAAEEPPWSSEEPQAPEPPYEAPETHETTFEAPEPVHQEPVYGTPEPVHETPAYEEPAPIPEEPAPVYEEPEQPLIEQPAVQTPAAEEPQHSEGYEIPGLPAPAPEPERPELPRAPAPLRSSRPAMSRRTRRTSAAGSGRRTPIARIAAIIALLAVLVAVVLVAHSLSKSSKPKPVVGPIVVKVLIPEGKTRVQIAQIASAEGLTGNYRKSSDRSSLLDPARYGAPNKTPDLEGFLFPATYDMDKGAPVSRLVEEQLTAFQENFGPEDVSRARALGVTPYQMLTVASMVEREAQIPGDRAKIAAVIYNRLKVGMPLGIDATIYYAVELQKNIPTYTHELSESELHIDSPYNTRLHTGLPPTPISNPGAASIEAAAHPAHVSYLYYVAGADGCGEQVFSNTQAEFEEHAAAYKEAVEHNGGHPPTCKHR